jgi:hypothetical protein
MGVDRNAAPVIFHRNGAVDVDRDIDPRAETGQVLVDGIVEHFENHVVQPAFVRVADIHAGALPDRFEAL